MTKYRKVVNEMDTILKMDGGIGYAVITTYVLFMTMMLTYGIWMDLTY
jgi:hypothetical protein